MTGPFQKSRLFAFIVFSILALSVSPEVYARGEADLKPLISSLQQTQSGMTAWQMVQSGGVVMIILAGISVLVLALIFYNFFSLKMKTLCPREFSEEVIHELERGNNKSAITLCESRKTIISDVVLAGLEKKNKGPIIAREAMEMTLRNQIGSLWQGISYLSDLGTIAPLIGLLGTVLGMIQAFNVIAFQTAVVKPILLAGGVSKAMVTTAGGLIVAIPALLFYSYFRGKVQEISNAVENYSSDIMRIIEGSRSK